MDKDSLLLLARICFVLAAILVVVLVAIGLITGLI